MNKARTPIINTTTITISEIIIILVPVFEESFEEDAFTIPTSKVIKAIKKIKKNNINIKSI